MSFCRELSLEVFFLINKFVQIYMVLTVYNTYMSCLVIHIVCKLEFLEGYNLPHPLCPRSWGVRMDEKP